MLHRSHPAYRRQFVDADFQFGFENALGAACYGASDVGEVLVTAERIHNEDADSWVRRRDKELARFKEAGGAGRHCEPLAPAQRDARVFDWLDGYLS